MAIKVIKSKHITWLKISLELNIPSETVEAIKKNLN